MRYEDMRRYIELRERIEANANGDMAGLAELFKVSPDEYEEYQRLSEMFRDETDEEDHTWDTAGKYYENGKPTFFRYKYAKGEGAVEITGIDHGRIAHLLVDMPGARCCKLDGTLAVWDPATRSYRMTPDVIKRRIIDITEDGYTFEHMDDETGEWSKRHLSYSTSTKERKEIFDYLHIIVPHKEAAPARYIAFSNGVLDLERYMSGDPDAFDEDPDPSLIIPNIIPHKWNPDAAPVEVVDAMFDNVSDGRANVRASLEEVFGHCMYRDKRRLQNTAALMGEGGGGKTTVFEAIAYTVGYENVANVKLQDFGKQYSTVHTIAGKLVNIDDDVSSEFIKGNAFSKFKTMVAGAVLHEDVKFDPNGVDFRNTATLLMASNSMFAVSSRDADQAVQDRITFIPCDARIRDTDKADPCFMEKLLTEEAAEYMIQLGIAGLVRLLEHKRQFSIHDEDAELKRQFITDNDTFEAWLDYTEYGAWRFTDWDPDYKGGAPGGVIKRGEGIVYDPQQSPHDEYVEFCKSTGRSGALSENKFSRRVRKRFALERGPVTRSAALGKVWRPYLPTIDTPKDGE